MKLLLVNDSTEKEITLDSAKPFIIGRGSIPGCFDKKVSRNHGELQLTPEGNVSLKSLHSNPCFIMKNGLPPLIPITKNNEKIVSDGDYVGLLPYAYWYRVVVEENKSVGDTGGNSDNLKSNGSDDLKSNGSDDLKSNGLDDLKSNGSDNLKSNGSDDLKSNGSDDLKWNGSDNLKWNGSNDLNSNGSNDLKWNGSDNLKSNGSDNVKWNVSGDLNSNGSNDLNWNGSNDLKSNGSDNLKSNGSDNLKWNESDNLKWNLSGDLKSNGSNDLKWNGSDNVKWNGSDDLKWYGSDALKWYGSDDLKSNGSDDLKSNGSDNLKWNGSLNLKSNGSDNLKSNGSDNLKSNGSDNLKSNGSDNLKSNGSDNLKSNGSDKLKWNGSLNLKFEMETKTNDSLPGTSTQVDIKIDSDKSKKRQPVASGTSGAKTDKAPVSDNDGNVDEEEEGAAAAADVSLEERLKALEHTKKLPLEMYDIFYEHGPNSDFENFKGKSSAGVKEKKKGTTQNYSKKNKKERSSPFGRQANDEEREYRLGYLQLVPTEEEQRGFDVVRKKPTKNKQGHGRYTGKEPKGRNFDNGRRFDGPVFQNRPICKYGGRCYRKNYQHKKDFCHPGDPDFVPYADRPKCVFGPYCYGQNDNRQVGYRRWKENTTGRKLPEHKRGRQQVIYPFDDDDDSDSDDIFFADFSSDEYNLDDYDNFGEFGGFL